ncbi:MAG: PcfJ domain-containing protein, partial [Myxococcota bacterium]
SMPRRNRRKLNHELRLRAEARRAEIRQARRVARVERDRVRAAADAVLRGIRQLPSLDGVLQSMTALLRLAGVAGAGVDRVVRTCRVVAREIPGAATLDALPWLLLLARCRWVRPVEGFVAPSGSVRRRSDALATWLLARYPVPPFLLRALDVQRCAIARVPVEDAWAVELLAHVGGGGSLRELVGTETLPVPLTRRMCHLFLAATAGTRPIDALRTAQVVGFGGPASFGRRLGATHLGTLRGPDPDTGEPFWHEAIGWMSRQPELHALTVPALDAVIRYVDAARRASEPSVSAGSATRLIARAAAWDEAIRRCGPRGAFPASGYLPLAEDGWTITELTTPIALWQEGQRMEHCAYAYASLAQRRKVSLWSVRRDGEPVATVEVAVGAGTVVQAKGRKNAACGPEELARIGAWAANNRLRIGALG